MPARTTHTVVAVVAAGATVAAALVGVNLLADEKGPANAAEVSAPAALTPGPAPAPAGWRWEVYGNVQVQVPADWDATLWAGMHDCGPRPEPKPVVRRPGGATIAMLQPCPTTPPKPLHIAPSVEFGEHERPGVIRYADGWTRETRAFDELQLTVTTGDDALRDRIFASAGVVESIDGNGCESAPALAGDGIRRPPSQGGLKSVGAVESISVCRYSTSGREQQKDAPPRSTPQRRLPQITLTRWPLQASSLIVGATAVKLVQDLVAAPAGTGPTVTDMRFCGPDPGGEVIVLRAHGSKHDQDVLVRYDGCKHNGTDDGSVLREFTPPAAKRIFQGVHTPTGHPNVLYQLLVGTPPPAI